MSDYAVIICCRMASGRLPGKALAELAPGIPVLAQVIERWRRSRRSVTVVAATGEGADNDPIERLCGSLDVPCYRGSREDVVALLDGALRRFAPEAAFVARGLADNPLVDIELADWRLDVLARSGAEGLWYGGPHDGLTYAATTDVWSRAGWEKIVAGSSGSQHEHPGAYFWNNLSRFPVVMLPFPRCEYVMPIRTELDTPEDLEMLRAVWCASGECCVPTLWALDWLAAHPEAARLNGQVKAKTMTVPLWPKGKAWLCVACQRRMAGIVAGDLEVRCTSCGRPQKWYAQKPPRSHRRVCAD